MRQLNYNHLLYFHTVATEGSISAAAKALHITPQTISGQIKLLEESLGHELFIKVGRGLVLSDTGHIVKSYSDDIFSTGAALKHHLQQAPTNRSQFLRVGIVDSIPKLIASRLLGDSISNQSDTPIKLNCVEGNLEALLADLAIHKLDLILSDRPIPSGLHVKAFNHELGASNISFFAPPKWSRKLTAGFPQSLATVPLLLPNTSSALRRSLDQWFDEIGIEPDIIAEFDDSALMKTFGDMALGVYPAPEVIAGDIALTHHSRSIGTADGVQENYLVISPHRRDRHPMVRRITAAGRSLLTR